jgi:hypothetical protein
MFKKTLREFLIEKAKKILKYFINNSKPRGKSPVREVVLLHKCEDYIKLLAEKRLSGSKAC